MARRADLAAAAALLLAACGGDPLSPPGPPTIASVSAAANSNTALSLLAVLRADGGDSARVHFRATGEPPDSTPFHAIGSGNDTLPVLGLRPQTEYLLQVEVVGQIGRASCREREESSSD